MMRERILSFPLVLSCRIIAVWPGITHANIYRSLWAVAMVVTQILQYRNLLMNIKTDDTAGWVEAFAVTITYTLLFVRIGLLWLYNRVLFGLFDSMAADWEEHVTADWQLAAMTRTAVLAKKWVKIIIGFYLFIVPIFDTGVYWSENRRGNSSAGTEGVMLRTMVAIDGRVSPFKEIFIVQQLCQQMVTCVLGVAANLVMLSFILHAAGQIDIICRELSEIHLTHEKKGSVCTRLKAVVERHQRVIHFCDDVEIIFTYMALMEFLLMAMFIGSTWWVLSVSDDLYRKVVCVNYFLGLTVDFSVYCNTGEYLRMKSSAVGDAVYESDWYNLKPNECQILLLLLLRSQRRLAITAGKLVDLSLEVFASGIKTSVSIVSLFYAVY